MSLEIIKNKIIEANIEIMDYLENSLKKEDFVYTNKIGFGGDNALKIDLILEDIFIKKLSDFGNIFSEECGFLDFKKEFTFIIDPLDGSNNFFSNIPYFGTSIAIKKSDEIVAGFVCNLASKILVYRVLDEDIKYFSLSKKRIIEKIENSSSKVAVFERGYKYPKICNSLNDKNIKFRILGATALSLANARDYDFVLFRGEMRDFDILAGLYICKDLYIYKDEDLIFITKYKDKFDYFKENIKDFWV
ncbi:inositol monophosphatase family protein [Arcobacter vandammei]|uniref:inositol monophosphatase family protein n=1 Tax=Arcobacter vandammei TaxID=2782243 RepID=UPI0018DF2BD6|nr:inositol monophosphatase family protein [Arcobacter vandammei]